MNEILGGGGFNSRLMKEIRVKRGLAYSTGSIIRSRKNTGVFVIYAQVGTSGTYQSLEIINQLLDDIKKNGVKKTEVRQSVTSLSNSFIFRFDTPMSILSKYTALWYNGLDDKYLVNFPQKISKIESSHIKGAVQKMLKRGVVTVIIGDESLLKQLNGKYSVEILE
jgi:zinc protease